MAIFFGSDLSKMDQTRKFSEQTSGILEFKPEGLDFQQLNIQDWSLNVVVKCILEHIQDLENVQ